MVIERVSNNLKGRFLMSTGSTGEVGSANNSSGSPEVNNDTGAAADSTKRAAAEATTSSKISTLGDLEKKYPEFYEKFINGMAQLIINQTGDAMRRVVKTMRQYSNR